MDNPRHVELLNLSGVHLAVKDFERSVSAEIEERPRSALHCLREPHRFTDLRRQFILLPRIACASLPPALLVHVQLGVFQAVVWSSGFQPATSGLIALAPRKRFERDQKARLLS